MSIARFWSKTPAHCCARSTPWCRKYRENIRWTSAEFFFAASGDGCTACADCKFMNELEFGRLQHRQFGWLRTLKDSTGIVTDLTKRVRETATCIFSKISLL